MKVEKIILDFDKKFIGKDLVISCNEIVIADYSSNGSVININDYSNVFFNEEFSYLWNSTLEDYCKGIYFHGYISFESEVYRRCVKPIFMWINALEDQISKHDICHIEFNSYINDSEVFVYEAEGEVNKKINYKSYFYIPKIISEYLSKKHPEICLIKKEKSKKRKENLFLFRNIMMFSFLFLSKFLCKIKSGKKSISNVNNNDLLLISTRSQVQSEYMLGLYEKYKNKAVFLCSEQSSKPSSNKNFLKSSNIDFYCTERELSLIKLLKIGFKVLNRYRKIKNPPSLEFKCGVVIPTSNILKEITIREFDFLVYEEGVKAVIFNNNLKVKYATSCDMFSPYSYYLKKGSNAGWTCQIQTTLISPSNEANFIYTDKFYFNSISLLNEMREKNPKYKNSFEFMPNLKKLKLIRKHNNYILKKVVYFSQPIYQDDEIELIVNIKKICDKLGLEFKIKPHPRQAQALFKDTNVQVLSNSLTFSSIIHDTDLVLTRTSTIGLDCWLNNIPVIFIRHNKHLKNIIADYLPLNYVGDISSVYELNDLLGNNSNYLFKQFYNISESFLEYNEDFDFLTSLENEK